MVLAQTLCVIYSVTSVFYLEYHQYDSIYLLCTSMYLTSPLGVRMFPKDLFNVNQRVLR